MIAESLLTPDPIMFTYPLAPLSEAQIERFYIDGYIVAEKLVPPAAIDAVLKEAITVPVSAGGNWTPKTFKPDEPLQEAALHRLLIEPSLVAAVEQIFEAPARVYYGMLAIVPAHGGTGLAWHQDNQYDFVSGRALNAFIALCDITPDKAILWVAPGSHLKGVVESTTPDGHHHAAAPANGVALPTLRKGDACLFDRTTLHHSKQNHTSEHRYAYAAQYQEANARSVKQGGKKDPRKMLVSELRALWLPLLS